MSNIINILVVGVGQMGLSHALSYQKLPGCKIVGMVVRNLERQKELRGQFPDIAMFTDYDNALAQTSPDAVSISTYPNTHAELSIKAMEAGAHVFVEKPLATNLDDARKVIEVAKRTNKKLLVGYILNHHPTWKEFVGCAKTLGSPLVMRMNLVQQSSEDNWLVHQKIMGSGVQPIVDCGIHYVDVMCQMVNSRPIKVNAMSAKLSEQVAISNYGQLQLHFEDGSIGWYEAGYGPSFSETAFFVKDIVGPKGSVSIVNKPEEVDENSNKSISADINSHTQANFLRLHHAELDEKLSFAKPDEWIKIEDVTDHDDLCLREQTYFLEAIKFDYDLSNHLTNAFRSLQIVLAADESSKTGDIVYLTDY